MQWFRAYNIATYDDEYSHGGSSANAGMLFVGTAILSAIVIFRSSSAAKRRKIIFAISLSGLFLFLQVISSGHVIYKLYGSYEFYGGVHSAVSLLTLAFPAILLPVSNLYLIKNVKNKTPCSKAIKRLSYFTIVLEFSAAVLAVVFWIFASSNRALGNYFSIIFFVLYTGLFIAI